MYCDIDFASFQQREHIKGELTNLHWHGVFKGFEGSIHVVLILTKFFGCRHEEGVHQTVFRGVGAPLVGEPRRKEIAEIVDWRSPIRAVGIDIGLIGPGHTSSTGKSKVPTISGVWDVGLDLICCQEKITCCISLHQVRQIPVRHVIDRVIGTLSYQFWEPWE